MNEVSIEIQKTFNPQNIPFIEFGLSKEKEFEKFIENKYGKVNKTDHYDIFDFENEEYLIEIKNRNNYSNDYKTTIIGLNKIEKGLSDNRKVIFLFGFSDGSLLEWSLDKSKTYEGKTYKNFSSSSFSTFNKNKLNCYIPISEMKILIPPLLRKETIPKGVCLIKIK